MKRRKFFAAIVISILAGSLGATEIAAQTKAPAEKTAATPQTAAEPASFDKALLQPATLKEKAPDTYDVKFTTTKGDFVVRVTREWAPLGADRFYNLVKHGYYNEASLFRVVPGFVVQFGISAYPQVSQAWYGANLKDDPVKYRNTRGTITFATSGANSRTTQVFINLNDQNVQLDGMGFAPFGQVVEGMKIVEQFYSGYAEATTSRQGEIYQGGKAFLTKNFPKLDTIKTAVVISPTQPAPSTAPAKKNSD